MPFTDRIRTGSIFVEPRQWPARLNPQRLRISVREFSRQIFTGKRRIFRPLFQPVPQRRVFGQLRSRFKSR